MTYWSLLSFRSISVSFIFLYLGGICTWLLFCWARDLFEWKFFFVKCFNYFFSFLSMLETTVSLLSVLIFFLTLFYFGFLRYSIFFSSPLYVLWPTVVSSLFSPNESVFYYDWSLGDLPDIGVWKDAVEFD